MKTKRIGFLKGMLSAVFMLALIITMVAVMPMTVSATNVSEVVYASNLVDGDDIVLIGDTTLYVNADVSLKSIKGDYALEIQSDGEHTLTIDNPNGCAIEVKTLKSVKPSQGTVNLTIKGGDDYFAIYTTGDISLDGTKLDVKGGAGIRSDEGNVTINGTNVSVVGNDGVGVIANGGSISIDSDYLFVQCAGQSGDADWEHGIGAAKDVTIISDDAIIAGRYGVASDEGNISLTGRFWVGARKSAVCATAGNITVNGDLTANNTDGNYYCVVSGEGDITLSNGTFNITSVSNAVITHNGDIYLNGDITVSSSETDSCAINAREGDIIIRGGSLDVTTGGTYALGASNGQINIAQSLKIFAPLNCRIDTNNVIDNASVIVDANGNPVSHVEIGHDIGEVSVYINSPVAGDKPASSASDVYLLPEHSSVKSIEWFVSDVPHSNSEAFTAGVKYKVRIVLKADDGYRFEGGQTAKINGKDASTGTSNGGKELIITYTFNDCPSVIKNIELNVAAPADGNNISYSVTDESAGYSVANNSDWVRWYESNDGVSYSLMVSGSKFVGGRYYKIEIDVKTHTGYEFALKDIGTIQPDVSAIVNGFKATVSKAWEQDPSEAITVTYTFGFCNDTIIENITIVDVPKPVPGEKPVYTVAVLETGYHIENRNVSREVYEGGQYVDKYYIRNGIGWYDVTADNWIYETDTFIAGHDYQCVVYVQTDDGYEFIQDLYANPEVWPTATVNGNAATILKDGSGLTTSQQIRYTFVYEVQTVTEVGVFDIDVPVGNMTPDYTATLGNAALYEFAPYGYELVGFYWYDSEDNILSATDKFVKGETYKLEIKLVRKMDGQRVLTQFQRPVTAMLNGKVVDAADVAANSTTVYIYQTYICDTEYLIEIDSASATITSPLIGEKPNYDAISGDSDKYTVTVVAWYEETPARSRTISANEKYLDPDGYYIEGCSYRVKVTFTPKPGYKFADEIVFIINGQDTTTWGREGQEQSSFAVAKNPKETYLVTYSPTDGSGTMVGDVVAEGVSFTLDECEFIAPEGYKFKAWAIGSPIGELMNPGQTIIVTADTYLIYAVWEELPHDCVGVLQSGQDATCTVNGWKDYYRCECGKYYEDANCQTPISDLEAWKVGAGKTTKDHEPNADDGDCTTAITCSVCGTVTTAANATHTAGADDGDCTTAVKCTQCDKNAIEAKATHTGGTATCTQKAECTTCGKEYGSFGNHDYGTLIGAVAEKHTQTELVAGIAAHYQCSVCDKYFTSAKVETTLQELTGATPSHSYGAWQTNDDKHWKECSCGLKSEENNHVYDNATDVTCNTCDHDRTLPHTHGNGVKQLGQSATCTTPGWNDYYKCSCGKLYTEADCTNEITDLEAWKTGAGKIEASHNYGTLVSAVAEKHTQTELAPGVAAHYHCSACGKYFTEGKVETTLEALTGTTPSHSYGDWKTDADKHWKECSCGKKADEGNHVDANSNNKCDSCDKTLSSGGVTPPPHTHDYGTTWKFDGTNHWKECSCGDKKEVTAHSGGTATCEAKAKCSECNTEYGELAEHKYSEATCTSKAKCSVCGDEKGEFAAHTYVDGKCACGATDPNYQPPHEHNFVEGKCECGETDPNYQPPHEHNFVEGKCECGETDPNYTPGTDTPGTDVPGTDVPGTDKPEDPDDGLSGGAIAGIVTGSVVVLSGGGFALWWFVFRKRKLI